MSEATTEEKALAAAGKDKQQEAASLEKVTDYVEEETIDSERTKQAMSVIKTSRTEQTEAERQREKELAAVSIKQDDVDVIVDELEVSRDVAIHALRANAGDLGKALHYLVRN